MERRGREKIRVEEDEVRKAFEEVRKTTKKKNRKITNGREGGSENGKWEERK